MKCCLLELERETTSEQCSLACASLGGKKKEITTGKGKLTVGTELGGEGNMIWYRVREKD